MLTKEDRIKQRIAILQLQLEQISASKCPSPVQSRLDRNEMARIFVKTFGDERGK